MTSITIILMYFGRWPAWLPYFLESCKYNPTVNFLFFTDYKQPSPDIPNLKMIDFSLSRFNQLAAAKLNLPVRVPDPYKLCDFKPAYGKIFENYLEEASFWGYSDLDIVFGNIRKFLTEEVLKENDVITAKKEYLAGHFTIYRNSQPVNDLYRKSPQYELVFTVDTCCSFDECTYLWRPLLSGASILDLKSPVESMTHVAVRQHNAGAIKVLFRKLMLEQDRYDREGKLLDWNDVVCWEEGKLMSLGEAREYMYFHFHFLKKAPGFSYPAQEGVAPKFYISRSGFTLEAAAATPL